MTLLMTVKIIVQRTANMILYALNPTGQIKVEVPKGKLCKGFSKLFSFLATETTE